MTTASPTRGRARRALATAGLVGAVTFTLATCGSSTPTQPDTPPVVTTTITLTSSGASPRNIQVDAGSRVRFVNSDSRPHDVTSLPHPEHTDCPEINQVGVLAPGQTRETGNLVSVRTCGYHDHDLPNNASLTGQIIVR